MINYNKRISDLREYMINESIDMCFIPKSGELEYLIGIPKGLYDLTYTNTYGDWANGIFIFSDKVFYFIPYMVSRLGYVEEDIYGLIDDFIIMPEGVPIRETVKKALGDRLNNIHKVAVIDTAYSSTLVKLKEIIPSVGFVLLDDYLNNLRMIKSDFELSKIKEACELTDEVFSEVVPLLKIGMSGIDIKSEIDYRILSKGCEGNSFHTSIMINGGNNKNHWNNSTESIIDEGCTIAFDFGLIKDGFCSDFGRTVYAGEPTKEMMKVHNIVMEAQKVAIREMIPGSITCEHLNIIARQYIKEQGYDDGFRHRLGHSIGRDVHEYPYLMPGYKQVLEENMTFTIEPSIIIDNKLLIRVEDVVAVGRNGGIPLSNYTKDIIAI